jgi:hypothetical protein
VTLAIPQSKNKDTNMIRRIILVACVLAAALPLLAQANCLSDERPIPPTLNGWSDAEILGSPPQFYKGCDRVNLSGIVWKFTGTNSAEWSPLTLNEAVTIMPAGYRPSHVETFTVAAGSVTTGTAWITVYPSGEVYVNGTFNYFAWVSLSGVSFRAQ